MKYCCNVGAFAQVLWASRLSTGPRVSKTQPQMCLAQARGGRAGQVVLLQEQRKRDSRVSVTENLSQKNEGHNCLPPPTPSASQSCQRFSWSSPRAACPNISWGVCYSSGPLGLTVPPPDCPSPELIISLELELMCLIKLLSDSEIQ